MSLSELVRGEVFRDVRDRGRKYFHEGRVRIESLTDTSVVARVHGSDTYTVTLERDRDDICIVSSCNCRHFQSERSHCKHVWATVLAASEQLWAGGAEPEEGLELLLTLAPGPGQTENEEATLAGPDPVPGAAPVDVSFPPPFAAGPVEAAGASLTDLVPAAVPPPPAPGEPPRPAAPAAGRPAPGWRERLASLSEMTQDAPVWPRSRQLIYVIDLEWSWHFGLLRVGVHCRDRKLDGGWTKARIRKLSFSELESLPEASDRKILGLLAQPDEHMILSEPPSEAYLNLAQQQWLLADLVQTGRCYLRLKSGDEDSQWIAISSDEGEPWQLQLSVSAAGEHYELDGAFVRGDATLELAAVALFAPERLLTKDGICARYEPGSAEEWVGWLRRNAPFAVPAAQGEEFVMELLRQRQLPLMVVPPELVFEEITLPPVPCLKVTADDGATVVGELTFRYGDAVAEYPSSSRVLLGKPGTRRLLRRDFAREQLAFERLAQQGWRWTPYDQLAEISARRLPGAVRELVMEGWRVEAEGRRYRPPGRVSMRISSGIDWFDLYADVEYDGVVVALPRLLAALRSGTGTILLDDGSYGVLPEQWLRQYGLLAGTAGAADGQVRYSRNQLVLLDVLLAAHPEASCDEDFARARSALQGFKGIEPAAAPAGFQGKLRPYQEEGLGWMHFLRQFGFGGCLADDMGLGKTVQVLALLESRRELREQQRREGKPAIGPALIVVPKSLIFNWKQEAARFAPRLKVVDHTGALRQKGTDHLIGQDLVLTTYGTLRQDAGELKNVRFDYVILDEAQAIKNPASMSAKAAQLLQSEHRLALSGTPVENHLGELWSLFDFLNPGMLGAACVFQRAGGSERDPDPEALTALAQALRPVLLRRTKEQVIKELPPKHQQTLYCELEDEQRRHYDELRQYYRQELLKQVESDGIGRSKIQVLHALLCLRQAAIHPGLLDENRRAEGSAKLDLLVPRLKEVAEEGHKALVFSQFTGMLSIVRERLDEMGLRYEYLDGKTRDREACVRCFQTDPECRLFLISLKAGGVGLNLTAAQYVFLLDPWWNPAAEAQAVDRAHRIGQLSPVFAYRIIARDTVEEKVLQLQRTKRELAEAIVTAENSPIQDLNADDLRLLLS